MMMRVLTKEECERYKRGLAHRLMSVWGLPASDRDQCRVMTYTFPTEADKWDAWMHDALYRAFTDYEEGEFKFALRGYMLAREYVGRCKGFYPGGFAHDAASALKQALEDLLFFEESAELRRRHAVAVLEREERHEVYRKACEER